MLWVLVIGRKDNGHGGSQQLPFKGAHLVTTIAVSRQSRASSSRPCPSGRVILWEGEPSLGNRRSECSQRVWGSSHCPGGQSCRGLPAREHLFRPQHPPTSPSAHACPSPSSLPRVLIPSQYPAHQTALAAAPEKLTRKHQVNKIPLSRSSLPLLCSTRSFDNPLPPPSRLGLLSISREGTKSGRLNRWPPEVTQRA